MCYAKPGPRCSAHARQALVAAHKAVEEAETDDDLFAATAALQEATTQYEMTEAGQEELRHKIENASTDAERAKLENRLQSGILNRKEALAAYAATHPKETETSVTETPAAPVTTASAVYGGDDDTNPALSVPLPAPIGRVYRMPGSAPLPTGPNGGVILPAEEEYHAKIVSGEWVPSITNVVGVRAAEHLQLWAAGKAAKEVVSIAQRDPNAIINNPEGVVGYAKRAADRDRDDAADKGTRVHFACEQIALGNEVPQDYLTKQQWKYVENFKRWLDTFQPEFIANEVTVFGSTPGGKYAGTADFIAKIKGQTIAGDYKTTRSGLHDDVAFQLAAVAHADHYTTDGETLHPMMKIDGGFGVHLSSKGFEMRPARIDGQSWEIFKALRATWNVHAFHGLQDDGVRTLGAPVTSLDQFNAQRF